MELHDELDIQLFHTLEKLKRIDAAIRRHQETEQPDAFAIAQWQRVKDDLTRQLLELMESAVHVKFQLAA